MPHIPPLHLFFEVSLFGSDILPAVIAMPLSRRGAPAARESCRDVLSSQPSRAGLVSFASAGLKETSDAALAWAAMEAMATIHYLDMPDLPHASFTTLGVTFA
jgi:hypothetical protein